ncbi:hypothetical protein LMIY3S_05856 [Labrys miyagiensis]
MMVSIIMVMVVIMRAHGRCVAEIVAGGNAFWGPMPRKRLLGPLAVRPGAR